MTELSHNINILFLMSLLDRLNIKYEILIVNTDSITRPKFSFESEKEKYIIEWPIFSFFGQKSICSMDFIEEYRNNKKLSEIINFFLETYVRILLTVEKKSNFIFCNKSIPRILCNNFSNNPLFLSKGFLISLKDLKTQNKIEKIKKINTTVEPESKLGTRKLSFFLGLYVYKKQINFITNKTNTLDFFKTNFPYVNITIEKKTLLPHKLGTCRL